MPRAGGSAWASPRAGRISRRRPAATAGTAATARRGTTIRAKTWPRSCSRSAWAFRARRARTATSGPSRIRQSTTKVPVMCRAIKTLHNFKPPATDDEIHASALQFVRKLSGFTRPSKANEAVFERAVEQVTRAAHDLLDTLVTTAPPRDRGVEAEKAKARAA